MLPLRHSRLDISFSKEDNDDKGDEIGWVTGSVQRNSTWFSNVIDTLAHYVQFLTEEHIHVFKSERIASYPHIAIRQK